MKLCFVKQIALEAGLTWAASNTWVSCEALGAEAESRGAGQLAQRPLPAVRARVHAPPATAHPPSGAIRVTLAAAAAASHSGVSCEPGGTQAHWSVSLHGAHRPLWARGGLTRISAHPLNAGLIERALGVETAEGEGEATLQGDSRVARGAHARGGVVEGKAGRGLWAGVAGRPAWAHALSAVALFRQGAIVRGEATHCVGHRNAVKSVRQARRHTGYYH